MFSLLLFSVVWSLVVVQCQTFPYVSFMGQTLANHSYVDLSLVGRPDVEPAGPSIQCHTDLTTCCSGTEGIHRGDWYFPNGTRLPFPLSDLFESRTAQRVDLHRSTGTTPPVGIYRCDIQTNAVHHDTDLFVRDKPVYVGLYNGTTGGNIMKFHICVVHINGKIISPSIQEKLQYLKMSFCQ